MFDNMSLAAIFCSSQAIEHSGSMGSRLTKSMDEKRGDNKSCSPQPSQYVCRRIGAHTVAPAFSSRRITINSKYQLSNWAFCTGVIHNVLQEIKKCQHMLIISLLKWIVIAPFLACSQPWLFYQLLV
jgi:hypothetical protein